MQIAYVLNCAADVCPNYFPNELTYKKYFLKDSKLENIECLFYDSIDFITAAEKNNSKVLVHCVQGVSRSISICLAYMIFKGQSYEQAFEKIKQQRGIASPNMGFTVQLLLWQKRLYAAYDSILSPRVFVVGTH